MSSSDNEHNTLKISAQKSILQNKNGTISGVEIQISDTGHGIPLEIQQKIFDPFFTTKGPTGGKNIGLGLSILKEVITHHNGNLTVVSEEGKGSTFIVFLPEGDSFIVSFTVLGAAMTVGLFWVAKGDWVELRLPPGLLRPGSNTVRGAPLASGTIRRFASPIEEGRCDPRPARYRFARGPGGRAGRPVARDRPPRATRAPRIRCASR